MGGGTWQKWHLKSFEQLSILRRSKETRVIALRHIKKNYLVFNHLLFLITEAGLEQESGLGSPSIQRLDSGQYVTSLRANVPICERRTMYQPCRVGTEIKWHKKQSTDTWYSADDSSFFHSLLCSWSVFSHLWRQQKDTKSFSSLLPWVLVVSMQG